MNPSPRVKFLLATTLCTFILLAVTDCGTSTNSTVAPTSTTATSVTSVSNSTMSALKAAKWTSNVTISFANGTIEIRSDGIPAYGLQSEYLVPEQGVVIPSASTSHVASTSTLVKTQRYDIKITTTPTKATSTTSTSLGMIGIMIDGAVLYNPYEGDGKTVALASNFTITDVNGKRVGFLDNCNGHPNPQGQYHYHGLPTCITDVVDGASGPSHIIGLAFDGFPIYGNRDTNGNTITALQLDQCNGITSPTPEFPQGIYHYVLLETPTASSSISCMAGTSSQPAMQMPMHM